MPRIKLVEAMYCVECGASFAVDMQEHAVDCPEAGGCVLVPALCDPNPPEDETELEAKLASGQPISAFCCGQCPAGKCLVDNWRKAVPGSPDVGPQYVH